VLTGYWDYVNNVPVYTGFTPGYSQEVRENYEYDGAGRIAAIRIAKGAQELDVYDPVAGTFSPSPTAPAAAPSWGGGGTQRSLFTYDLMGRQLTQSDYNDAGTSVVYGRSASYDLAGKLLSDSSTTIRSGATYVTSTSYGYTDLSSGEYLLGVMGSTTSNTSRNGAWQYTSGNSYTISRIVSGGTRWRSNDRGCMFAAMPETGQNQFDNSARALLNVLKLNDLSDLLVTKPCSSPCPGRALGQASLAGFGWAFASFAAPAIPMTSSSTYSCRLDIAIRHTKSGG
jgi:hypothetical protein